MNRNSDFQFVEVFTGRRSSPVRILDRPISVGQFAEFAFATKYQTVFEGFNRPTWLNNAILDCALSVERVADYPDLAILPATELTVVDAEEYLAWQGRGKLPNIEQLASLLEAISHTPLASVQSPSFELVTVDSSPAKGLGHCCILPSMANVNALNAARNTNFSLLDHIRATVCPVEVQSHVSATFRFVDTDFGRPMN